MSRYCACVLIAAALASGLPCRGGALGRVARTRAALDDLEAFCARSRGASAYQRVPLLVGRRVVDGLERVPVGELDPVLDHVYEASLRAKLAVLETLDGRRRALAVPPALRLGEVTVEGGACRRGGRVVFPVVVRGGAPGSVAGFFAGGALVRRVPALAGGAADGIEGSEVCRLHERDPRSRRVGWGRPAGGFLCDAAAGRPAVLISIDHPPVREAIARDTAAALAARAGAERPLYVSLGEGCFYTDYSEASAERFVAWLAKRYGTARAVDAAWDTRYEALGPAMMPAPEQAAASQARWRDWTAFNQWRLGQHVRWARANVRRAAPEARVGMSVTRYLFAGSLGLSGVEPVALGRILDVVEANGADPMAADLASAAAGGDRPVIDAGAGAGPFGVLPHVLHGGAAVALRAWPPAPLTSLAAVRGAERALREALDARRLAAELDALARVRGPVALVYSRASMRLAPPWALRCAATPYTRRLAEAHQAARFLDVGCRFVTSAGVAGKGLGGARVVVVAGSPAEEEGVARALVDYVETGGHLVVLAEAWATDDCGREADYLMRLGIEVLETSRPRFGTTPRPERGGALDDLAETDVPRAALAPGSRLAAAGLRPPLVGSGVVQKVRVNVRHEVLAAFDDGGPAIVSFRRGKGRVTYLATALAPERLVVVFRAVLAEAGVEPGVRLVAARPGETWGLECRSAMVGGRRVASVWNTTGATRWVSLGAASVGSVTSLSTGEPLEVRRVGEAVVAGPVRVPPYATVVVELGPAR